ncbi:hypothetical protein SLA2020_435720 [Shorea laevis]
MGMGVGLKMASFWVLRWVWRTGGQEQSTMERDSIITVWSERERERIMELFNLLYCTTDPASGGGRGSVVGSVVVEPKGESRILFGVLRRDVLAITH